MSHLQFVPHGRPILIDHEIPQRKHKLTHEVVTRHPIPIHDCDGKALILWVGEIEFEDLVPPREESLRNDLRFVFLLVDGENHIWIRESSVVTRYKILPSDDVDKEELVG